MKNFRGIRLVTYRINTWIIKQSIKSNYFNYYQKLTKKPTGWEVRMILIQREFKSYVGHFQKAHWARITSDIECHVMTHLHFLNLPDGMSMGSDSPPQELIELQ